jgi:hypothetical protein
MPRLNDCKHITLVSRFEAVDNRVFVSIPCAINETMVNEPFLSTRREQTRVHSRSSRSLRHLARRSPITTAGWRSD